MGEARYKPYPAYKPSGVEWLGDFPANWETQRSKTIFRRVQRPTREADGIVTAFRDGEVTLRSKRRTEGFTNAAKEIGYQGVRVGDLLVHAMDGFAGAIGISDSDGKCSPVCSVCVPIDPDSVHMPYYGYLVRQLAVTDYITSLAKGIRERSTEFRYNEFSALPLAVPSLPEQTKIAAFLDYETGKIDGLIAKQERLIALLEEKRQAVISHAVTKGLNPTAPLRPSGIDWLGDVPAHWEVVQARRAIETMEQGKSPECHSFPANAKTWGVLKSGCVNRGVYNQGENKELPDHIRPNEQYEVKTGDVLMSRASGSVDLIGSVAYVYETRTKLLLSDKTFRIALSGNISPQFFVKVMSSGYVRELIKQSISGAEGMANNITKGSILGFPLPIPSKKEQQEIADFLDRESARFDALSDKAQVASELLMERRTALISAAVTGKIDVRDWQPPQPLSDTDLSTETLQEAAL